jgi:two-component system, LuxR family, response regulator FixJ
MLEPKTVFVVDDDAQVRESVCALISSMGYDSEPFQSAEEFLAKLSRPTRGVLLVDLRMPGMSGLDLLTDLRQRGSHLPVIILTAYARTATTVKAMQSGAVTILDKPYNDDDLWDAIRTAFTLESEAWQRQQRQQEIEQRLAALTDDERRALELIVQGKPNKIIAKDLGVALRTVEKRRHDVFFKMQAGSLAELVELVMEARASQRWQPVS